MSLWRLRAWLSGAQRRVAAVAVLAALAILGLFVLGGVWTYLGPGPKAKGGEITTVMLEKGSGVRQIAHTLGEAGIISSPTVFVTAARLTGAAAELKAGEYDVRSGASMASVLSDIRNGRVVRHLVTIPEGWTVDMALEAVNRQPVLTGFAATPPEGAILPDTYQVHRGQPREEVVAEMRAARDKLLADLWAARQPGLPISTPEEAVTLASIVEKETALASERPRIAAVFVNRLRKGMRLESDPTIIYGISRGRPLGRGLLASEVQAHTPYNTYRVDGLPPTPIANPGRESLKAVLNPPQSGELFFVADGTGGHVFASTYDQHLRNVARWRQVERSQGAR